MLMYTFQQIFADIAETNKRRLSGKPVCHLTDSVPHLVFAFRKLIKCIHTHALYILIIHLPPTAMFAGARILSVD